MKTLIRLLLEEQSDLGLHCLSRPFCPKTLDLCMQSARRLILVSVSFFCGELSTSSAHSRRASNLITGVRLAHMKNALVDAV